MRKTLVLLVLIVNGCASHQNDSDVDAYWTNLRTLCGQAFEGRMIEGTEPSDAEIGGQRLVMHVRRCLPDEIRIPFHVGENRSRVWVLTRTEDGIQLEHEHRHEDGSEDEITRYGGRSIGVINAYTAEFPADRYTAELIPAAASNVWTMQITPGRTFTYALRREDRRFRVDFDLTSTAPKPPPPWGARPLPQ